MKILFSRSKRLFLALFIVTISAFLLFHKSSYAHTQRSLNKISSDDRKILEDFFREMLFEDSMAYVIFGTKPMALSSFSQFHPQADNYPTNAVIKKGWHTWKKYEKEFPHPNYILRTFGNLEKDECIFIVLINKKHFTEEFQQYPEEYKLLTQNLPMTEWFKNLETSSKSFAECFHLNHMLRGIAFGYSKHNSLMFQKKWDTYKALKEKHPDKDLDFIDNEYEQLEHKVILTWLKDEDPKAKGYIKLPVCATDPEHEETKKIRKRYAQDRESIMNILSNRTLLEAVLEKLTSPD